MTNQLQGRAIAIVGVGAILPDAPTAEAFWDNLRGGRYSIGDIPAGYWDPELYYDPDHSAPAKTYSKIGGWVRSWDWEPMKWRLPIPPKVSDAMDRAQQWAVAGSRQMLADYGYPNRPLNRERTAVIFGNAMAGDNHYWTAARIVHPEFARLLARTGAFESLPASTRDTIAREFDSAVASHFQEITEDTMPGELSNIIAGRVASLFDFHGPNYVCDAACASAMAAIVAAVEGLEAGDFDAVLTGGIDANMGPWSFTKFSKIGALSATGTRPYADGADGFVMGEGAALFLLKRLADAERDGDPVYAVLRGLGGSSDGRGKGITAPNPIGQRFAIERAWRNAGVSPHRATLIEGHGTSTQVGDVVEVQSLHEAFGAFELPTGSIPLGSVKSNIGHLKGAAGAAGVLKAALALHHKMLPPSLGFARPNPQIDFASTPFRVNTELRPWDTHGEDARRAGVSAFGFGGTNFHAVLEEHIPGRLTSGDRTTVAVRASTPATPPPTRPKPPLRGALLLGGRDDRELGDRLRAVRAAARAGDAPAPTAPRTADLRAAVRLAIDYANAEDLADKAGKALDAFAAGKPLKWRILQSQGIYLGRSPAPKVAFLFTGQGSQYVNMMRTLATHDPVVAGVLDEADPPAERLLGAPLRAFMFADPDDVAAMAEKKEQLRQTQITQPSVLAVDTAMCRLLDSYGIAPDMVMGHSLGEYGALVAAQAMTFPAALEAVSARGREMAKVDVGDQGLMAAVMAPLGEVEKILAQVDGYVVIANKNSFRQSVIGGETAAVEAAMELCRQAGFAVQQLVVSHAFHTRVVAPASGPMREVLGRLDLQPPVVPLISNVTGDFYPTGPDVVPEMIELLGRQIAEPVQFVEGLQTLYEAGARVFVESGPKRALTAMAGDVLGGREDVLVLSTNHPKLGDIVSFNRALCGMYASGLGTGRPDQVTDRPTMPASHTPEPTPPPRPAAAGSLSEPGYLELGRMFAEFLERGAEVYSRSSQQSTPQPPPARIEPVVISGAALGLPGGERVFDDGNVERILRGDQFIGPVPEAVRRAMVDKNITRLVKTERGEPHFETIDQLDQTIKLAGRAGALDLVAEFGFPAERVGALESTTQLAIGAGLDALRDAGIPLVMRYKTTTTGSRLPERWALPDALRDDTGVIFASAFTGADSFAKETKSYYTDRSRRERLTELEDLRRSVVDGSACAEIDARIAALRAEIEREPYGFDRRFLFRLLAMGHSQFAELIGARGPNTQLNTACASTTMAVAVAEDWIRAGRARRVVIISSDDVSSDELFEWIGAGFLASGAAATDGAVEDAAIPFDRRRHGMIVGMGAAAMVIESTEAARERGVQPICEVLSATAANSAFHGTRLDVDHIAQVMERTVADAEQRWHIDRHEMAPETVFVSHETYTPARGGSAQAEVNALRTVFGADADRIVVSNTKGFTGHAMGTGIEDVVAVKALETGVVPPVANFREVDPELGALNLSRGGTQPVRYALRLGAGFGSQICMSLVRWVPTADGRRRAPVELGFEYRVVDRDRWQQWLAAIGGHDGAELEVVQRTLRIRDGETPPRPADAPRPAREPAPAVATASSPAAAAATHDADGVQARVLKIVSEVTGYPPDMLDLDLDMEADLGIDTVKQAETFAALRKEWGIPRDDNLQLRDFPTLAHAIQFVHDRRPDRDEVTAAPVTDADAVDADDVETVVLRIVSEVTGYPPDMLDLDLDMEADLGIDTVKQAETFAALRKEWDIPRDDNLQLRDFPTLAHAIQFVHDRRPDGQEPTVLPTSAVATASDDVETAVLAIVSEVTGYPPDMLDLDLDMEADLGIDTVKQAETFAALRKEWDIPRDDNLQLRDFPTLAHAIQFVHDRRPDRQEPAAPATATVTAPPTAAAADEQVPLQIPRRVPVPVLRPPLDLCKPTGITLDPGCRVLVMPDRSGVSATIATQLAARGVTALILDPETTPTEIAERITEWRAEGPIRGIYWLPALDHEGEIDALAPEGWREAVDGRVKALYHAARVMCDDLGSPDAFLISATRLGGRHGYDDDGAWAPMGGAVVGFTKALARERSAAMVKAVDFAAEATPGDIATRLVEETLRDPGVVEVGHHGALRWTIGLAERAPSNDELSGSALDADSVVVVTGAAGSIVSAIVADLARCGGTFHLLDLAPEPDAGDPDLTRFATDRMGLQRELFERIKARGDRATPVAVEHELAAIERRRAALVAIEAVRDAGGEAHYHHVDLLDADAVAAVIDDIRSRHGRIDVLLHAAGIEVSHVLPDKEPREFDLVFDVKSDGWYHLLRAIGDMPLVTAVVFSSVAGRFGNYGQTDYSAANDLLCKYASSLRRTRGTRGIALDWSAWADIGMASRGSIPKMMELAGIDMLPPAAAIPVVRREIDATDDAGEIVVALTLGALLDEVDETGGLDLDEVGPEPHGPVADRVLGMGTHSGLTVETVLDPTDQPFLFDHKIDDTAVLPGVMGLEAFAETALLLHPYWQVRGLEDVEFLAPFKFYRDEPRAVRVYASFDEREDDQLAARCSLIGMRDIPNLGEPQVTEHFRGTVVIAPTAVELDRGAHPAPPERSAAERRDIYALYFHGPAYRVLERTWIADGAAVGLFAQHLPANHRPAAMPAVLRPRLIELCFQTAGIWELAQLGRMGLPAGFDRLSLLRSPERAEGMLRAVARPRGDGVYDIEVVDEPGHVFLSLSGYRTIELTGAADVEALAALRSVTIEEAAT